MADNSKLTKAKELLEDIERIYQKIGVNNPFDGKKAQDFVNNINDLKDGLEDANDILHDMDGGIGDLVKSWKAVVEEVGGYNNLTKSSKNSISSLTSIAEKLRDHQKGITDLSSKDLKLLSEKYKSSTATLKSNQTGLQNEISALLQKGNLETHELKKLAQLQTIHTNITSLLGDQDSVLKEVNKKLEDEEELTSSIEKKTGVLGGLLKGMSKIPILGDIFNANEALDASKKSIRESNNAVSGLGAAFKNIGKQIKGGVLNPANLVLGVITGLIDGFAKSQTSIGELAKGLGMSASRATEMRQDFASIANLSMEANVSVKGLQESQLAVGQALGTNAKLNDSDLVTLTKITKQTGLQHDELIGIEKLSLSQGKSLDSNLKSALGGATAFASQNKLVVNNNKVLQEVNKASGSLKLSLGGSVEALGKAVVQTQKMGINLETASSMAQSLLDFESSIENELSAELLTGKNLNLEKARQLSLEGDIAGAAEEVLKQVKGTEEFSKMNVLQQESMAKAVGMTRDQLADSLIEREALAAMSAEEGETALQAYNKLKESGATEDEIIKKLGDKAAKQLEQQSSQEKFNAALEKAQEIFVQIMDALAPIFDVLSSIVTTVLPAVNFILQPIVTAFTGLGKILTGSFDTLTGWQGVLGGILTIWAGISAYTKLNAMRVAGMAAMEGTIALHKRAQNMLDLKGLALGKSKLVQLAAQAALWALANPLTALTLGVAAGAGIYAATKAYMKDGMIGPGGEMIVSGPKGSIQLDKDDSIVAGTDLFGGNKKSNQQSTPTQPSSTSVNVDMGPTNALLQQLINVISAGGDVVMDGQKVGQALNLIAYKTQ
jgi:hypothetical protein